MRRRWIGPGIAGGVACFGLGLAAARLSGGPPAADHAPDGPAYVVVSPADAGLVPRIVFDPASIQLLPDASLQLDLPRGFDAGDR